MKIKNIHYAWKICLGCALLVFCTIGLAANTFSIYLPYILENTDFTNTQVSALTSIRNMSGCVCMLLAGVYYKKLSLRTGMAIGGICSGTGFILYSLAQNYSGYCLAAIVIGFGYGLGTMIPVAMIISKWFDSKRATALGICSSCTGLSNVGFPSVISALVEKLSLQKAFLIEGIFILCLIFLAWLLLRDDPEKMGLAPYRIEGDAVVKEKKYAKTNMKPGYWIILVPAMLMVGSIINSAYGHIAILMTSQGIAVGTAANIIMVSGLALILTKNLYGIMADRFSAFFCNCVFGVTMTTGLALSCVAGNRVFLMTIALMVFTLGTGMCTIGVVVLSQSIFDQEHCDSANQKFQFLNTMGGIIFSLMPGMLADLFGGSYVPSFVVFTVFALLLVLGIQFTLIKNTEGN